MYSIQMHIFSHNKLFPPHSFNVASLAPPQSGADTLIIAAQNLPAHPTKAKAAKSVPECVENYFGNLALVTRHDRMCICLQFRLRPPGFNGVVQSPTLPRYVPAAVLVEISSPLDGMDFGPFAQCLRASMQPR